jgi:hypothetical protein
MRRIVGTLILFILALVAVHARWQTTVLQPSDFTYLNCYYDPDTHGSNFTYSQGLAFHYVGGDLRFVTVSFDPNGNGVPFRHLEEFSLAGKNCGDEITTKTNDWDLSGYAQIASKGFISFWFAPSGDLWINDDVDYTNVLNPVDLWSMTLGPAGSITNFHGPIHLDQTNNLNQKRTYGGFAAVPAAVQSAYSMPAYVTGFGGYASLVGQGGGASMGLTMYAIPDITGFSNDTTLTSPGQYKTIADHFNASGTTDWYINPGNPLSFDRGQRLDNPINYYDGGDTRVNPPTYPTGPPAPGAQWLSPAPDGKGRFVWGDSYYNTGMWITGQRSAFVAIASLCQGMCVYLSSNLVSQGRVAEIHIFDQATLGAAYQGSINPWNVQPAGFKTLNGLPGFAANGGLEGNTEVSNASGAVYDPATHRMYLMSFGSGVDIFHGRLYVFDVNTGGNPPPPDTTPPTVSVTAPAPGTVSGVIPLTASATDAGSGVKSVQFLIDGLPLGTAITSSPYTMSWDTGAATNGSHVLKATATDNAANTATSAGVTVTVSNNTDSTPPSVSITAPSGTISGVVSVTATATDAGSGVAGVQFKVDGVNIGAEDTTAPYSTSWDTSGATNSTHTITAVARDVAGNVATSSGQVVTVSNPTPDTTPPTVTETNTPGTYAGNLTLTATCTDNVACVGTQFLVDGGLIGLENTTTPAAPSLVWDTTSVQNGAHTLSAKGRDKAGNSATSATVSITVNNAPPPPPPPTDTTPPTVSWTSPLQGARLISGTTTTLTAMAADNVGVVSVTFKADNVMVGSAVTTAPYAVSWNITSVAAGDHTLTATAVDAANNSTTAAIVVTVVVQPPPPPPDTTPPTVQITSPANGAVLTGGTATLVATAADNVAVASVQFAADGVNLMPLLTSPPYQTTWNLTNVSATTHTVTAVATDTAGNTATSIITVSIPAPPPPPPVTDTTPPTVVMTAPISGATVSGLVTISATAFDASGVGSVQFSVDNTLLGPPITLPPYTVSWNSSGAPGGNHILTASALDTVGNRGSASLTVITLPPPTPATCASDPLIVRVIQWPTATGNQTLTIRTNKRITSELYQASPRRVTVVDARGCTASAQ